MIDVQEKETWVLSAPFIVNGVDATETGTAVWTSEPVGSVNLSAVNVNDVELTPAPGFRGVVTVTYSAKGLSEAGEVVEHGVETYNIIDNAVVIRPSVEVVINSTLKV
jgi:hypothetical protein